MMVRNLRSVAIEKIQKQRDKLESKLEGLVATEVELEAQFEALENEVNALEDELAGLENMGAGQRELFEGRRERLMAKRERLELKAELHQEKRERLEEALEDLEQELERYEFTRHSGASPGVSDMPSVNRDEERKKILEMLEKGKITVEDASRLLDAIGHRQAKPQVKKPRWVRIRVTNVDTAQIRMNLKLPLGIFRAALRGGGSLIGVSGLDSGDIQEKLAYAQVGHLIDIVDEDDGERVEITLE